MPQWCTRQVFRCFKWLERAGDRLTGAAGPVFVTLAIVLISIGVFCFFEVIQPSLAWPWVTTPICLLIALNLFAHYYYVCTISPGFVNEPPRVAGAGLLWARRRREAGSGPLTGVRWSEDMHVTRAETSKCRKCGEMRPEDPWPYYAPPMMFMMIYILAVVLCLAVSAMAGWHLYMVASGETSVETQDHEQYRKIASQRGELAKELGAVLQCRSKWIPYTDGRAWARRAGFEQHLGVRPGEELTDEEEE
ncbi:hypothetical protein TRAPUB_13539 [Trametes pubescens]|uniref:Protein S-acyltransferase n=1 Tax=Trametes pubescens TaxID=154538 RepID=A0A1M2VQX9_TRAPU|nr:hypothetical protein TRAPUB_13539 [Trametes pubescens]